MNNDFTIIPFATKYSINREGVVIKNKTKEVLRVYTEEKYNSAKVALTYNDGLQRTTSVPYILAQVFLPIPENLKNKKLVISYIDGDNKNKTLSNLKWSIKNLEKNEFKRDSIRELALKHNVPEFTKNFNGYYPNIVECLKKPGFYFIPWSEHPLVLSKEGIVFNLETQKEVNKVNIGSGYKGLPIRWNTVYKSMYFHRLMALMFIANPDNKPEVNHKDGNKHNYSLDNLEWVTKKENINHAIETGLINFKPVLSRNILTNVITSFLSIDRCAKKYDINPVLLNKRLISGTAAITTKDWHVFKFDDETPWSFIDRKHFCQDRWNVHSGVWYAHNRRTKSLIIEDTFYNLCNTLNLDKSKLVNYDFSNSKKVIINEWEIHYDEDPNIDDYKQVNPKDIRFIKKNQPIKIFNKVTGEKFIVESVNDAARQTSIPSTTISLNLAKHNGKAEIKIFYFERLT